jgi:hypothetical protein
VEATKREAQLLLKKAVNSLILSIEIYNRPWDRGRHEATLILLDHSFEMLLKSAIIHRGGKIRKPNEKNTIGFESCIRMALTDEKIKFLTQEQILILQMINSLRDAAQHHLLDISEQHLYIHAQAGLTLFRELYKSIFGLELHNEIPERVLPISTIPPTDILTIFNNETEIIKSLFSPNKHKTIDAINKIRSIAIVDRALQGVTVQPTDDELKRIARALYDGKHWSEIFPGVASITLTTTGYGPSLDLRFTKKEGIPIHIVPEGTPGAYVIGIKRVNELDFYNLSHTQIAQHIGLSAPKTTALIRYLKIKDDQDCYKQIVIGKTKIDRYSQKALDIIKKSLNEINIDEVWRKHGYRKGRKKEMK